MTTIMVGRTGYSLVELIFVLSIAAVIGAMAMPLWSAHLDEVRIAGAVHYLSSKLARARMEAIARSADVGLLFVRTNDGTYTYAMYLDGNGNGIRSSDIRSGTDPMIVPVERLSDHFDGVGFGVLPGLPAVETGTPLPGSDPIKLGAGSILTFTPSGTSSSGSLYVLGATNLQRVIRIFGETAKTRTLAFDVRSRQWRPS